MQARWDTCHCSSPFLDSLARPNREPFQNSGDGILALVSYSLRICSSLPM